MMSLFTVLAEWMEVSTNYLIQIVHHEGHKGHEVQKDFGVLGLWMGSPFALAWITGKTIVAERFLFSIFFVFFAIFVVNKLVAPTSCSGFSVVDISIQSR